MVKEFPKGKEWLLDNSALRVSLDMTFVSLKRLRSS